MSKSIFNKLFICIIFIIVVSNSICLPVSHALGDVFSKGKEFLDKGNNIGDTINTTVLEDTSAYIYNTLIGIAIMVAIIVAMVLGIQFMAASADEKAKVKEAILPFAVGCVVVFGAFTIWKIAVNIGNNAEETNAEGPSTPISCTSQGKEHSYVLKKQSQGNRLYECSECGLSKYITTNCCGDGNSEEHEYKVKLTADGRKYTCTKCGSWYTSYGR